MGAMIGFVVGYMIGTRDGTTGVRRDQGGVEHDPQL